MGLMVVDHRTLKSTPHLKIILIKNVDGDPYSEVFAYTSIVVMLLHLSGHSHSDIFYSVIQVERFIFWPGHCHEVALKLIGRYNICLEQRIKVWLLIQSGI